MHDVLTSELDPYLANKLVKSGGAEYALNRMYKLWNTLSMRYYKRDHQKLIVCDNKTLLGSTNISIDYARRLED